MISSLLEYCFHAYSFRSTGSIISLTTAVQITLFIDTDFVARHRQVRHFSQTDIFTVATISNW